MADVKRPSPAAISAAVQAAAAPLAVDRSSRAAVGLAYRLFFALRAARGERARAVGALARYGPVDGLNRAIALLDEAFATESIPITALTDEEISAAHETAPPGRSSRREAGVFYTPPELASALAREACAALRPEAHPTTVLDPACGTGAFLVATGDAFVEGGRGDWPDVARRLHGWDIDPVAVEIARARVLDRAGWTLVAPERLDDRIHCRDSLRVTPSASAQVELLPTAAGLDAETTRFDLVIGNPPFGNAIGKATARTAAERGRYAHQFPNAATGAYDRAGLFVELGLQLCAPSGVTAMVVPRAMLAAPYSERLRGWVTDGAGLQTVMEVPASDWFRGADVRVAAVVLGGCGGAPTVVTWHGPASAHRRAAALPSGSRSRWAVALSPYAPLVAGVPEDWRRLDEGAAIQASATVEEAYDLRDRVVEAESAEPFRLITSGTIEPLTLEWGKRRTRYLKRDYQRPGIPREALSARRRAQHERATVLVAGLSRVLEAAVADEDTCGAVATLAAVPITGTCWRLAALICSTVVRAQFLAHYAPLALGGGSVQVTKKKLAEILVPPASLLAPATDATARARRLCQEDPAVLFGAPDGLIHEPPTRGYVSDLVACGERIRDALQPAEIVAALDELELTGLSGSALLGWADACVTALDPTPLLAWLEADSPC